MPSMWYARSGLANAACSCVFISRSSYNPHFQSRCRQRSSSRILLHRLPSCIRILLTDVFCPEVVQRAYLSLEIDAYCCSVCWCMILPELAEWWEGVLVFRSARKRTGMFVMVPDASGWTHMPVGLGTLAPRVICPSTISDTSSTLLVILEAEFADSILLLW